MLTIFASGGECCIFRLPILFLPLQSSFSTLHPLPSPQSHSHFFSIPLVPPDCVPPIAQPKLVLQSYVLFFLAVLYASRPTTFACLQSHAILTRNTRRVLVFSRLLRTQHALDRAQQSSHSARAQCASHSMPRSTPRTARAHSPPRTARLTQPARTARRAQRARTARLAQHAAHRTPRTAARLAQPPRRAFLLFFVRPTTSSNSRQNPASSLFVPLRAASSYSYGATPQGARCVELRLKPQLEAARSLTSLCSPRLELALPRSPRLASSLARLASSLARLASSLASPPRSPRLLALLGRRATRHLVPRLPCILCREPASAKTFGLLRFVTVVFSGPTPCPT